MEENVFDSLSKTLAQASRRQAIGMLFRGVLGGLATYVGFANRQAHGQSGTCTQCGTCSQYNPATGEITPCKAKCEAQTLCGSAQSNNTYMQLTAMLTNISALEPTGYSALITASAKSAVKVLQTTYVSSFSPSTTANLFVVWGPNAGQVSAYAVQYQNGTPAAGYYVMTGTGITQIAPPYVASPGATNAIEDRVDSQIALPQSGSCVTSECAGVCSTISFTACTSDIVATCAAIGIAGPEATVLCILALAGLCYVATKKACEQSCNQFCNCPPGQTLCTYTNGTTACCDCSAYCNGTCQTDANTTVCVTAACLPGETPCPNADTSCGLVNCCGGNCPGGAICCPYSNAMVCCSSCPVTPNSFPQSCGF